MFLATVSINLNFLAFYLELFQAFYSTFQVLFPCSQTLFLAVFRHPLFCIQVWNINPALFSSFTSSKAYVVF